MSSKAKRQRGKAAAKAPPKKGTKRARDEDKSDKFAESVLASVTCPISHSLVVQPVVAEDGQVYERERIETWLQKKETSPFTRKPMGTQLVDSVASRSIVASAIENGLVDAEAASAWHLGSARLKVVEKLPGGAVLRENYCGDSPRHRAISTQASTRPRSTSTRRQSRPSGRCS